MARKLDYRWHLRQVMAGRGMFATTDLIEPLAARGIRLSSSQVYRLVAERPERLSLKILMARAACAGSRVCESAPSGTSKGALRRQVSSPQLRSFHAQGHAMRFSRAPSRLEVDRVDG